MRIKITRLKKSIEKYESVVLYGAGNAARLTIKALKEEGIAPAFCIVSEKGAAKKVDGICVFSLNECVSELQKDHIIIIIAVTKLYQKEIEDNLVQKAIWNYIFLADYMGDESSVYRNMTQEEYLKEVAEWYVDRNHLPLDEISSVVQHMQGALKRECDSNKILLIVGNLSPRVIKIAGALQKKGYTVEVLCYLKGWINKVFLKKLEENSDIYLFCNTLEEMMYQLIYSGARIAHVFSNMSISNVVRVLIDGKELFPKIALDQYDIANEMYPFVSQEILDEERYCLENVEGLVCRGFELEYLVNQMGYKISAQMIEFFDYCDDLEIDNEIKKNEDELSLCYAGGLVAENEWKDASYFRLLEYADVCEKNKCHLHVYPSTWTEQGYAKYIALDKESPYFHFHKPVPYENLMEELSRYDYGIGLLFCRALAGKKIDGYYTKEKLIYAACNHFYDYVSVGLPIISAVPIKLSQYFKKQGVLLDWALEDYDFKELKNRRNELRKNVSVVREKLRIDNQISKLINFYDLLTN